MEKPDPTVQENEPPPQWKIAQKQPFVLPAISCGIKFEKPFLRVWEDEGKLDVHLVREETMFPGRVRVATQDGTAKTGVNFSHIDETVVFLPGQDRMVVPIDIFNDPDATGVLNFYVQILDPDTRKRPDLEEDDEGKSCEVRIDDTDSRWSSRIRKSDTMNRLAIFWTIFALFVHDLWIIMDIPKDYDNGLGWMTVLCFAFFIFEFWVNSSSLGSKYYLSTAGLLDILATLGVLILIRLEVNGTRINIFSARAARIAGRAGRATRIPKLLGQTVACIIDMVTWFFLTKPKNPDGVDAKQAKIEEKSQTYAHPEDPNLSAMNTEHMSAVEGKARPGSAANPQPNEQPHDNQLKAKLSNRKTENDSGFRGSTRATRQGSSSLNSSVRYPRKHRGARSVSRSEVVEMKLVRTNKEAGKEEHEQKKDQRISKRHTEPNTMMDYTMEDELELQRMRSANDEDEVAADAGKVGGAALEVLTSKVMLMLIILLILVASLANLEEEDATQREMGLEMVVRTNEMCQGMCDVYNEVLAIYTDGNPDGTRWNPNRPLIYLKVNGTEIIDDANVDHLRYTEMLFAHVGDGCGNGGVVDDFRDSSCNNAAIFNNRQAEFIVAGNGLVLTICLTIIVTVGMAFIAYDFQNLIFGPMRRITVSIDNALQIVFGEFVKKKKELEDDYDSYGDDDNDDESDTDNRTEGKNKEGKGGSVGEVNSLKVKTEGEKLLKKGEKESDQALDEFVRFETAPGKTERERELELGSSSQPSISPLGAGREPGREGIIDGNEVRIDIKHNGEVGQAPNDSIPPSERRIPTTKMDDLDSQLQNFDTLTSPETSTLERIFKYLSPDRGLTRGEEDDLRVSQLKLLDTLIPRSLESKWSKLQIQIKTAFVDVQKAFGINTGGWSEQLRKANLFVTELFNIREEVYEKVQRGQFTWEWLRDHLVVTVQEKLELNENHLLEAFLGTIRNNDILRKLVSMILAVYEGRLNQKSARAKTMESSTVNVKAGYNKKRRATTNTTNYDGDMFQNMEETARRLDRELQTMNIHTLRRKFLTLIAVEHLRVIKLMQKSCIDFDFRKTIHRINHSFNRIYRACRDPSKRGKVRLWMVIDQASNVTFQDCVLYAVSKCLNENADSSRREKGRLGSVWNRFEDSTQPPTVLKRAEKYLCERGLAEYEKLRTRYMEAKGNNGKGGALPEFKGNRESLQEVSEALEGTDSPLQLPVDITHLFYKLPIHKYLSVLGPVWNIKHTELASCTLKAYLSGAFNLLMNTMVIKKFGHRAQTFAIQFGLLMSSVMEGDESLSQALRRVALDKQKAVSMRRMLGAYLHRHGRENMLRKTLGCIGKFTSARNLTTGAPYFTKQESAALGVYLTRRVKVASYLVTAVATVANIPPELSVYGTFEMFGVWALKGGLPIMLSTAEKQDPKFKSKKLLGILDSKRIRNKSPSLRKTIATVSQNYTEEMVTSALRMHGLELGRNMRHPRFYDDLEEKIVLFHTKRLVAQGILSHLFISSGNIDTAERQESILEKHNVEQQETARDFKGHPNSGGPKEKQPLQKEGDIKFKTLRRLNQHIQNLFRAESVKKVLPELVFSNADPPGLLKQKLSALSYDRKNVRNAMAEGLVRYSRLGIPKTVGEFLEEWVRKTGTAPFAILSLLEGSSDELIVLSSLPRLLSASVTDLRLVTMMTKGFIDMLRAQKLLASSVQEAVNVPLDWIASLDFNVVEMYQRLRSKASNGTLSGYDIRMLLTKFREVCFEEDSGVASIFTEAVSVIEKAEVFAISALESLKDGKTGGNIWETKHLGNAKRSLAANSITASIDLNQAQKLIRKYIEVFIEISLVQLEGKSNTVGLSDPKKLVDLIRDEKLSLGASLEQIGMEILIQTFCKVVPSVLGENVDRSVFKDCKTILHVREVAEEFFVETVVARIQMDCGELLRADQQYALNKCRTLSELHKTIRLLNRDLVLSHAINLGSNFKDPATQNHYSLSEKSSSSQTSQPTQLSTKFSVWIQKLPLDLNGLVARDLQENVFLSILANLGGVKLQSGFNMTENLVKISKLSFVDIQRALLMIRNMGRQGSFFTNDGFQFGMEMLQKMDAGLQGMMALQGFILRRSSVDLSMLTSFVSFTIKRAIVRSIDTLDHHGVELSTDRIMELLRSPTESQLNGDTHGNDADEDNAIDYLNNMFTQVRAVVHVIMQDLFVSTFNPLVGGANFSSFKLRDDMSSKDVVMQMEKVVVEAVAARAMEFKLPEKEISRLLQSKSLKECNDFITKVNHQAIIGALKKQGHIANDKKTNWGAVNDILSMRPELSAVIEQNKLFNELPSIRGALSQALRGSELSFIVSPYLDGKDNPFDFIRAVVESEMFDSFLNSNSYLFKSVKFPPELQKRLKTYRRQFKKMYDRTFGGRDPGDSNELFDYVDALRLAQMSLKAAAGIDAFDVMKAIINFFESNVDR